MASAAPAPRCLWLTFKKIGHWAVSVAFAGKCYCCEKCALPEIAPRCWLYNVYSVDSMNCIYIAFFLPLALLFCAEIMNEIDASSARPTVQLKPPTTILCSHVVVVVVVIFVAAAAAFMSRGNFISVKHPVQAGVRLQIPVTQSHTALDYYCRQTFRMVNKVPTAAAASKLLIVVGWIVIVNPILLVRLHYSFIKRCYSLVLLLQEQKSCCCLVQLKRETMPVFCKSRGIL